MTSGVIVAVLEELIEPKLGRLGVIKRNAILESVHARKTGGAHIFSMAPHINLRRIGSERTSIDIDLVITHCSANLIDVVCEVSRGVLGQVMLLSQFLATSARRRRVERT